ncbi:hypothetical protein BU24DRAFT_190580 [Aaosphaeria arxii CBS 175.79]|uniref:Uncharacterized protein n=1 Tax=Aaosphaeria arxii CBS 175.79 TaxID=1450172 RepID=A0A6A5XSW2_9PLEO|nr:uncharacterized protein BU24DRAFT_190580 [Aaosphaeria arxii CBS 175.79]KAF2016033.1 hypothetical protein BU24DRAFT_190580 [Aaosphaeria arxii CBS 175.79]
MAANVEKPVTFGATIEAPANTAAPALRSAPSHESALTSASTCPPTEKETPIDTANPFSAFYKHPDARRSMDGNSNNKMHLDINVAERDLESGVPLSAATTQQPKVSVDGRVKECTMWPSRQAMMEKKKMSRRARGCNLFRNLNSKQRLWAKIVIALFVIAAAVGLGVGISRAVGGGVWSSPGQSKPIPNS